MSILVFLEAVPIDSSSVPSWLIATFTFLTPLMVAFSAWVSYKARGKTDAKIQEIHVLANDRLTKSLDQIDRLQVEVGKLSETIRKKDEETVFNKAVDEAADKKAEE